MSYSDDIYNLIKRCKYNQSSYLRDIYSGYLNWNINYIDQDQVCTDLDYLYDKNKTDNGSPVFEGFSIIDNSTVSIVVIILFALFIVYCS